MSRPWLPAALATLTLFSLSHTARAELDRAGRAAPPVSGSRAAAGVEATGDRAVPPALVRVRLTPERDLGALLEAGLDVVDAKEARAVTILLWPGDDVRLERLGLAFEVLDPHPGLTAARRAQAELAVRPTAGPKRVRSAVGPDGAFRTEALPPFGSGSMGGYWTSDEIKMKLDDLVASDVNDVVADKLDTLGTSGDGRPIWGLELGKQVVGPDTRPVAFFNALTHAREPEGMQALFYFVDDLLSRYGTDPFATYLLDHRVIYIVPLVNPDGYHVNEDYYGTYGFFHYWRKNTRDNNGNHVFEEALDGVDINRNYGYQWAYDDIGSSPDPTSETYRGPGAFSEPESQVQRDAVIALQPVTGFSFHTWGDVTLHAWAFSGGAVLSDLDAFREWSDELTQDNAYLSGPSPSVLYQVNGEFNDWCYGDTLSKPRAYTWTPEIGTDVDYFWPPPSRIVPLAQENVSACYVVAALAGPYVQEDGVSVLQGAMNAGHGASIVVRARNLGITGTAGPGLIGTLTAIDAGVDVVVKDVTYPTLGSRQSGDPGGAFEVAADDTLTPGRLIRFEVAFSAPDGFYSRDTLWIPAGTPTLIASDDASSGLGNWSPTDFWGIETNDPDHPSRYFADSPGGAYANSRDNHLQWAATLDLSAGVHAYAFYDAQWEFEPDYDAGVIEASLDGNTWTQLDATGTTPGSGVNPPFGKQPLGKPVYAGSRRGWKPELADLSAFTGPAATAVRLRFQARSDQANPYGHLYDGFNFDSLRIVVYDPAAQPGPLAVGVGATPAVLELAAPRPNPVRGHARFEFSLPREGAVRLEILDVQGRRVRTLVDGTLAANRYVHGWDLRDAAGRAVAPGMYLAHLSGAAGSLSRRFVVVR